MARLRGSVGGIGDRVSEHLEEGFTPSAWLGLRNPYSNRADREGGVSGFFSGLLGLDTSKGYRTPSMQAKEMSAKAQQLAAAQQQDASSRKRFSYGTGSGEIMPIWPGMSPYGTLTNYQAYG
jgi:hypothetical protein